MPRQTAAAIALTLLLLPAGAAAQQAPIVWRAEQLAEIEKKIAGAVDPARHLGLERLLDSATLIYRDGPSEAEVHESLADFITVRSGEGEVTIGGTIVDGRATAPGEQRGTGMRGGTTHVFKAGDIIYIPANTVHQFLVPPGKHFVVTIVKITPKP